MRPLLPPCPPRHIQSVPALVSQPSPHSVGLPYSFLWQDQVDITSYNSSSGVAVLTVRGLKMLVRKPGRFYLQPIVSGVAGTIGGDILIEKYNAKSASAIATQYANRIGMAFLISMLAIGNSVWHDPRIVVPVSILFSALMYVVD